MTRLSQLWSFLFFLWTEPGSILEPNGGLVPTASSGDNGSGLEPNG